MRRNSLFIVLSVVGLALAGLASADTLTVNNAAAMGGTGTACSGSNCGLQVTHDNTSAAYVQDNTPDNEAIYRFEFMFDPNGVPDTTGSGFRQEIFRGTGTNPRPGQGLCHPSNAFADALKVFLFRNGSNGNVSVSAWVYGNQCGARGLNNVSISSSGPVKICGEWEAGSSDTGRFAVATVATNASCPPSGDGAYVFRTTTNHDTAIVQVRMGTIAPNANGAGENGNLYFDEFASFRTLAP